LVNAGSPVGKRKKKKRKGVDRIYVPGEKSRILRKGGAARSLRAPKEEEDGLIQRIGFYYHRGGKERGREKNLSGRGCRLYVPNVGGEGGKGGTMVSRRFCSLCHKKGASHGSLWIQGEKKGRGEKMEPN